MIDPAIFVVAGLALVCLAQAVTLYRRRGAGPVVRYVDTSGVLSNPPKSYIDVWRGKTLNVKLSRRHTITIPHVSVPYGLTWIEQTAGAWAEMKRLKDIKAEGAEATAINLAMKAHYLRAVECLYRLTKPFARFGYRAELFRRADKDFIFICDVIEQVYDFWLLVKKKLLLLAQGQTLRATDGGIYTWDNLKLDDQGRKLITPRFENS